MLEARPCVAPGKPFEAPDVGTSTTVLRIYAQVDVVEALT